MRILVNVVIATALLACACGAHSHHSYAMFDTSQVVTIRGTLRTLEWTNPHVWLWLEVNEEQGNSTFTYGFESLSPGQLQRDYGWNRRALKPGDVLTIDYAPLKSGNRGGALIKVTLPDGTTLLTRFSAPKPTASGAGTPETKK
jgi:hypothetical protein